MHETPQLERCLHAKPDRHPRHCQTPYHPSLDSITFPVWFHFVMIVTVLNLTKILWPSLAERTGWRARVQTRRRHREPPRQDLRSHSPQSLGGRMLWSLRHLLYLSWAFSETKTYQGLPWYISNWCFEGSIHLSSPGLCIFGFGACTRVFAFKNHRQIDRGHPTDAVHYRYCPTRVSHTCVASTVSVSQECCKGVLCRCVSQECSAWVPQERLAN